MVIAKNVFFISSSFCLSLMCLLIFFFIADESWSSPCYHVCVCVHINNNNNRRIIFSKTPYELFGLVYFLGFVCSKHRTLHPVSCGNVSMQRLFLNCSSKRWEWCHLHIVFQSWYKELVHTQDGFLSIWKTGWLYCTSILVEMGWNTSPVTFLIEGWRASRLNSLDLAVLIIGDTCIFILRRTPLSLSLSFWTEFVCSRLYSVS